MTTSQQPVADRPSPYEQLLHVLGDSDMSRLLINRFARSLAETVRHAEGAQWPGPLSAVIDPFQHTRESWSAVTGCPPTPPAATEVSDETTRVVEYVVQTRQPDGVWESSSRFETDAEWAVRQLARHRRRMPQNEHRIVYRTTTVTVRPITVRAGQSEGARIMAEVQQPVVPAGPMSVGVVFEPTWEDNPTWEGSELYSDLALAQKAAANAYAEEMYDGDGAPDELVWVTADNGWALTEGGAETPVSISTRTVHGAAATPSADDMTLGMLIALLTQLGGSYDLPATAFTPDLLGTPDGHLHAAELQPLDRHRVRLQVVPRPADHSGGIVISGAGEG